MSKKKTATKGDVRGSANTITAEEKAAMRALVKERKAAEDKAAGEKDCAAAIAKMSGSDKEMAQKIHKLVLGAAPDLAPRTYYGMPAYAKDGAVLCFFQDAAKFKSRYATFGFTDKAMVDEGSMWPNAYALMKLTAADEKKISALVKKAVS